MSRKATAVLFSLLLIAVLLPTALAAQGKKTQPAQGFEFDFDRWPYPLHAELNEDLTELARKYPNLAKTEVIGKTAKGRPLAAIAITNFDTGSDQSKPAIWLDANIHATEITGRLYLMYFIERLLFEYGKNPEVTRLVDTRTFYVLPAFDADGGERVLTRHPIWKGHVPEEQLGKDLDGDGYIMMMRIKDDSVEEGWRNYEGGYRYYREGADPDGPQRIGRRGGLPRRDPTTGEREETDFNRNWSAEWKPTEPGAGPFPFSQPEVHAVATFLSSHRNIFFVASIHSGGGGGEGRSYLVRPPMNHPYVDMHHEDNDWYIRAGAVWSHLSEGMIMENNYASFLFNTSQEDEEGNQVGYAETMVGFMNDWVYMHLGIHAVIPEISGAGIDYDGDGYFIPSETARWHKEVMGNKWLHPWKRYEHPELGRVEIGGERVPSAIGERAKFDSEAQFDWYLYVADQAPVIKIVDLKSEPAANGSYRITAKVQNQGWLSTYVTRNAIEVKRDYPAVAEIDVKGGSVAGGEPRKGLGHILGKHAFIRYWVQGQDRSTKTVEWIVEPTGSGPLEVTVTAMAPKGGRDEKSITVNASPTSGH